jgi:FtsP/CotA-like multicopper oxidase with cupredoxin domain
MTSTLTRRQFLLAGSTITGGALLGIAGCDTDEIAAPPRARPLVASAGGTMDLAEPRLIRSAGTTLTARIPIATHAVRVADAPRFEVVSYGGAMPGPTLWANAGDVLDLTFANRITIGDPGEKPGYGRPPRAPSTTTHVHVHGLHVTPTGRGDNMLVMIEAGQSYRYRFAIPGDHPAGLFWYHPHVHGLVTNQLGRGACGLLYVANAHTRAVDQRYRRRLLAIQQLFLEPDLRTVTYDDGNREDPTLALTVINGELMPTIRLRPGERQVWCVANASTSAFYALRLPSSFGVRILAYDGLTRAGYVEGTGPLVLLPPGKRVELEVLAPSAAMSALLSLDAYFQGVDTWPAKPLATLVVEGQPAAPTPPVPLDPAALPDLSGAAVARSRRIVFDQDDGVAEGEFGRFRMYLEGSTPHSWNPDVPEWTDSVLGTVEQWTILNHTEQEHPFHVHVNPFQVTRWNGAAVPFTGYNDTAIVPRFGSITVRTRFSDFSGGPVLMHCHILDHEDMGMMTRFEIAE